MEKCKKHIYIYRTLPLFTLVHFSCEVWLENPVSLLADLCELKFQHESHARARTHTHTHAPHKHAHAHTHRKPRQFISWFMWTKVSTRIARARARTHTHNTHTHARATQARTHAHAHTQRKPRQFISWFMWTKVSTRIAHARTHVCVRARFTHTCVCACVRARAIRVETLVHINQLINWQVFLTRLHMRNVQARTKATF